MIFSCDKSILQEAIDIVQKASSTKTTYPILEGILIEASDNKVTLTATDLDFGIETKIDAQVTKPGAIVLNSKLLGDFIRKLPNDQVNFRMIDKEVNITCQKTEIFIIGNDPSDFPALPSINENAMYEMSQYMLKNMIRETIFAISTDDTRPILSGVLFEVKKSKLSFVALDGYRLALSTADIDNQNEISAVIPGKTLGEISKILLPSEDIVKITFTPNHILFNLGNTRIISKLLNGEFINYRQILPDEYKLRAKVKVSEFMDSIERASLVGREGKTNLVKLEIHDEHMIITSNSQMGKVSDDISIELNGDDIKIAFNSKYLIDVLRIIDSEEIYLEFTSPVSPCIIKKSDSEDYIYLVLPVRLVDN